MENQIRKYVPLMSVVAMAIDEDQKSDLDRYWIFGHRAVAKIYRTLTAEPKTQRLPLTDANTVIMPSDCIEWTKVGVMGSNGEVMALAYNPNLSKVKDINPQRLDKLAPDVRTINDDCFLNYFENDQYSQLWFNNNSQLLQPGEFNVDETNHIIILPPKFGYDSILLEYISSPEKDKEYQVEQSCQEAIIAFIKWKAKTGSSIDFYNELSDARRLMNPLHLQVINQVIRQHNGWKVKG